MKDLPQRCEPTTSSRQTARGTASSGVQKLTHWVPSMQ